MCGGPTGELIQRNAWTLAQANNIMKGLSA
jgi:hypothetical protein